MFKAFKLTIEGQQSFFDSLTSQDTSFLNKVEEETHSCLLEYLNLESVLDGTKMQNDWFPAIKADVFISHSHADEETAKKIAAWLYKNFGITAFIDSCVWGYAEKLLKTIDNKYCKPENSKVYDYYKRNQSTSHVYMMLSNALVKMMDRCECILFLNTPNSIKAKSVIEKTHSPWIFHEISTVKTIRINKPERPKMEGINETFSKTANAYVPIEYNLDFSNFLNLDLSDFTEWKRVYEQRNSIQHQSINHPLDVLYEINN